MHIDLAKEQARNPFSFFLNTLSLLKEIKHELVIPSHFFKILYPSFKKSSMSS